MAAAAPVVLTNIFVSTQRKVTDLTALPDDTTATVPHGMALVDVDGSAYSAAEYAKALKVTLTPLTVEFYAAKWFVASIDATNVVLTKAAGAGTDLKNCRVTIEAKNYTTGQV